MTGGRFSDKRINGLFVIQGHIPSLVLAIALFLGLAGDIGLGLIKGPSAAYGYESLSFDFDGDLDVDGKDAAVFALRYGNGFYTKDDLAKFAAEFGTRQVGFSVVLLPDTQYYSRSYPQTYLDQTRWIIDHLEERNIQFVIHLGDITHNNTPVQWSAASAAHSELDSLIPYSIVPGNHDIYPSEEVFKRDYSNLNSYFPPSRFVGAGGYLHGSQNNYTLFEFGDLQFLVISLEMSPTKDALCWANQVIEAHPFHRVIIVTHCYQNADGGYNLNCDDHYNLVGCDGQELWDEFISRHSNIFMVLSGHINGSIHGPRNDTAFGNTVHQVLTDFQKEPSGGNGWLRVLYFFSQANTSEITSEVLSVGGTPLLSQSNYPADPEHPQHAFTFNYDMVKPVPENQFDYGDTVFNDRTVNPAGSGNQLAPKVAMDENGKFVVVWEDDTDGNDVYQIYARGFYAGGCERFYTVINSESSGQQRRPDLAVDQNGNFVVVWEDDTDGNDVYQIYARGFFATGTQRFADMTVNSVSTGQQLKPSVAMDENGNFVVVWEDDTDGNGVYQIYARGFYANGTQRFADMTVNSVGAGQQLKPSVAMAANGNFVVAWEDDMDGNGENQIYIRGFYAGGSPRFSDRAVNTVSTGEHRKPKVAMDDSGNFVVVWEDDRDGNGWYQILSRGFDVNGAQRFPEMTVNTVSSGQQLKPSLGIDANGDFVVVWEDDSNKNNFYQILARGFYANGTQRFSARTINGDADGQQLKPSVAMTGNAGFVVTWEDDLDKNGRYEILARGLEF